MTLPRFVCLCWLITAVGQASLASEPPHIVTTIQPLQIIIRAITRHVTEPARLLEARDSLHHYTLRPSDIKQMDAADSIVLMGWDFEPFMQAAHERFSHKNWIVLSEAPGLELRAYADQGHDHDHGTHDNHSHGPVDKHLWLSPTQTLIMARYLTEQLCAISPAQCETYRTNLQVFEGEIDRSNALLAERFAPVASKGFVALHDALGYVAHDFHLQYLGAFTYHPDDGLRPSVVAQLEGWKAKQNLVCIVGEPHHPHAARLAERFELHYSEVNPEYSSATAAEGGVPSYSAMMEGVVEALLACLGGTASR